MDATNGGGRRWQGGGARCLGTPVTQSSSWPCVRVCARVRPPGWLLVNAKDPGECPCGAKWG